MMPYHIVRLFILILLIGIAGLSAGSKISADNPVPSTASGTVPLEEEAIVEFDLNYGSKLLLDTAFGLEPNSDIKMLGHKFRTDIPHATLSNPWLWAAKLITFDNRCSQLIPLGHPHLIRASEADGGGDDHDEKAWGTVEHPVLLEIEVTADPDMHELEIIDELYNTVGKFDVAVILEEYCESNPEEGVCLERKKKLIVLDGSAGTEDLQDYILEEFDQFDHLNKVEGLNGMALKSTGSDSLLAVNLDETSQSSPMFTTTNDPFDELKRVAVYNGSQKIMRSDSVGSAENPDGSVIIDLSAGVRGIAFTLGHITPDAVMGKDIAMEEASERFDYYLEEGAPGELKNVAQSIKMTDQTIANISVYGVADELIENAQINLLPVPGFHTFVGLVTPNTLIHSVEIDYKGGTYVETLTDLMIIPEGVGKLPSKNFNRIEQPCPGFPLITGAIKDFESMEDLESRRRSGGEVTGSSDVGGEISMTTIKTYIEALLGRGYTVTAPGVTVDDTNKRVVSSTSTPIPAVPKIVVKPTPKPTPRPRVVTPTPSPQPTPIAALVVEETPQRNILIRFFRGIFGGSDDSDVRDGTFSRATGGTQDGSNEESGGSCNLPGNGYEGLPLLAVLLLPAWLKYSRRGKR